LNRQEPGNERLPNYWCQRQDPLTVEDYNTDMLSILKENPEVLSHLIGGNTGTVNSWESVDIGKFTEGVYPNYDFLLKDNNYVCLGLQQAVFHAPLWLDKMYENSTKAYNLVLSAVSYFDYLKCPNVTTPFSAAWFVDYPGWNRSFAWPEWQ
jgi:hypothetical protein